MFRIATKVLANNLNQGLSFLGIRGSTSGHSRILNAIMQGMKIKVIPALEDNYMYLIVDEKTRKAAAVDPVDPEAILSAVKEEEATLTTVLTTHHHWDHAGGNKDLLKSVPVRVLGGDDRIEGITDKVSDGFRLKIGDLEVDCLSTPCHTNGHICYVVSAPGKTAAVFTGDTLFVGGCGKFFEGSAQQMCSSLQRLAKLPDNTSVYCGHEYTTTNLQFAKTVEPNNSAVISKLNWAELNRNNQVPTVPSTIGEEKSYNPFMRVGEPSVQNYCGCKDEVTTMQYLRDLKNRFKPKKVLPQPSLPPEQQTSVAPPQAKV